MLRFILFTLLLLYTFGANAQVLAIAKVQGQQAASPYAGQEVTIKGIVTAAKSGAGYFLQDADSAWSGVFIYDLNRSPMPNPGDEVQLTGKAKEYYDLTEIEAVSAFEIISTGNELPEPIIISTGHEAPEAYEGMLVKVVAGTCTNSDIGYGEWEINDGSGPLAVDEIFYKFASTEGDKYDITGIMHYTYSAYKIAPRNAADIEINSALYFVRNPYQLDPDKTSITLKWETNVEASSEVHYGISPDLLSESVSLQNNSTKHEIVLQNLNPGELYYTKAFSVAGSDTTRPVLSAFTTVSNSSGEIKVVFTSPDNFTTTYTGADESYYTKHIADSIAAFINKAQQTLDIAIYDVKNHSPESDDTNQKIFDAIKAKASSGVQVRIITDNDSDDAFFTEMLENAQVMWGNTDGIMHHKFIVVDAASENNSGVLTGSTNWTYNNLVLDANNLITIQDQSLAKAYTAEFNEMWGGPQSAPDYEKSRFASNKADNTPHLFSINGKRVELYFSPSDNTESKIIDAINSANHEIAFNIMAFTSDGIGAALIDAHKRGVNIKGVIDYVDYSGSEYEKLQAAGIDVVDYTNADGLSWPENTTVHHKYLVADYLHPESDPLVLTGTHNWSASAESRNDENTLIIYDQLLAELYYHEVEAVYANSIPTAVNELLSAQFTIYPNPVNKELSISGESQLRSLSIFDLSGRLLLIRKLEATSESVDLSSLSKGIYMLKVDSEEGSFIKRLVKQ
ncbi:phospholipase D-like domain-containing protein [Roseimarinus sediminis]|uniref:phospholipase D-like domain-containing protein n=1 Tax=Roseimarinus sediminis TaxID=1610899 RepID=UPI003D1B8840